MDDRIAKWLFDVQTAINDIESFLEGTELRFGSYQKNKMLKRAIERELKIIGEAMNRIIKRDKAYLDRIQGAQNIVDSEIRLFTPTTISPMKAFGQL